MRTELRIAELLSLLPDFFLYREDKPLLFTQADFWLFFLLFLSGYSLCYQSRLKNFYLLVFSLFFYYKSSGWAVLLLLFTITQDFWIGHWLGKSTSTRKRNLLISLSVVTNLMVLAYFKYAFLLSDWISTVTGLHIQKNNWLAALLPCRDLLQLDLNNIILPAGISFFLFHSISYTVDIYRREIEPLKNWVDYGVFVSFFPELVAGPIVRAKDFVSQLTMPFQLSRTDFGKGVALVLIGLCKKIVISDMLSTGLVDKVFDQPELCSVLETWFGVIAYAFQIFCDFSGYTDIAIGLAMLLGYHLKPNFNEPYKALSITDFWRRWHISLSAWLRDYLYIPLGGNRKGTYFTYQNLLITMLLGGLWHGASLKFLIWGGLHGSALAIHKIWMEIVKRFGISIPAIPSAILTFTFVAMCWIPFRATDEVMALAIINKLMYIPDWSILPDLLSAYADTLYCLLAGMVFHFIPWSWKATAFDVCGKIPVWMLAVLSLLAMIFLFQFSGGNSQPFIYFQF